jgi:hypothetical protein
MDTVRKTGRDALIEKLHGASQRTRLQSYVLETISTSLRDRQISPGSAMQWVLEEGLLDRLEEVN